MITVKQNMGFNELLNTAWGQAINVLNEIQNAGMEDELMNFLEDLYPDAIDFVKLNDLLSYDWEWVYSNIGMPSEVTYEENEEVE